MPTERTQRLIDRVARRIFLGKFARRLRDGLIAASAIFLLLLLVTRVVALLREPPLAITAGVLSCAALLYAFAWSRRVAAVEAARLIDSRMETRELFLAALLAGSGEDGFQSIVHSQAEARAVEIEPNRVVPFDWQRGAALVAAALIAGVCAFEFLPQLDPLGRAAQRQKVPQQEKRLQELKLATTTRAEQLAQGAGTQSEEIKHALEALEKTFQQAKPKEREVNLARLAEQQKELGEMWRKVSNELPRDAFEKAAQSFGQADAKKIQEWREALKKGDLSDIKKTLGEMREQMKQLAAMPDSAEKRALQQQLMQKLNAVADAVKEAGGSAKANEALARALQQLDQAKLGQLSREATDAAADSLKLSEAELEQLAKKMQDGQSLEDALKNLQMAKQLAAQEKLDGGECKNCKGMDDYAALFAKKMAEGKSASVSGKSGMGEGIGNGARRPEDDRTKTDFMAEKSSSALANGKLLMQWKSSEVGETGARAEDYRDSLRQVKQGVSEAIAAEQVPPGYRAAIQKYFDSLPVK